MEEWIWIIIVFLLIVALSRKDKELLDSMPKKKREKILKEREISQKKNLEMFWIVMGIIILVGILFILWLSSLG